MQIGLRGEIQIYWRKLRQRSQYQSNCHIPIYIGFIKSESLRTVSSSETFLFSK